MLAINFDYLLYILMTVSGLVSLVSGVYLIVRSFLLFRSHINRSMSMDLEVIRVTKNSQGQEKEGKKSNELWKEEISVMEQLLTSLSTVREKKGFFYRFLYENPSISFEIANSAKNEEIIFYVAVPKKFREATEKQITSFFTNAVLERAGDYNIFAPKSFTAAAELKLKNKFLLPVRTYQTLESDPLNAISNALSKLDKAEEGAAVQLVMQPTDGNWRNKGREIAHKMQQGKQLRSVYTDSSIIKIGRVFIDEVASLVRGNSEKNPEESAHVQLTPEEQELIKGIERKSSKSAFKVNIRLVASGASEERAQEILSHLENAFSQFENSDLNCFQIRERKKKEVAYDFIFRNFDEDNALILSVEEISSIFHVPVSTTEAPKIKWLKSNAAPPPINIPDEGLILGFNDYRGTKTTIRIPQNDRRRHMYIIGQTGTGKSNLLKELAKQDARDGKGFCVIDPHGDFAEDVLAAVPKERAEDVVYFDPADIGRPFGLNMLEYDPKFPEQKTFVINEMIGIFDQLYDLKSTGGPMFEQYMRNAMLLIMEDPESGSTLLEISKVLADEEFRKMKLTKCKNPIVYDFWTKEAEKAGGEASLANMVPYITSKLTTFISNDIMRPIISQQKSTMDFREIMDSGKIFLMNLSKGKIGEINANLLGMVVVGKIMMAALSRVDTPEEERRDFYLYMDEFQNVTTKSIAQILSEARKYRLCLILAHQFVAQIKEDISKAIFGNVGSIFSFRVGSEDAEMLQKQFEPVFSANDLVNVDNYHCFARTLINNQLTKPFNMATYPPSPIDLEVAAAIKELSRLKYGRDASIVNEEIMARTQIKMAPGAEEAGAEDAEEF